MICELIYEIWALKMVIPVLWETLIATRWYSHNDWTLNQWQSRWSVECREAELWTFIKEEQWKESYWSWFYELNLWVPDKKWADKQTALLFYASHDVFVASSQIYCTGEVLRQVQMAKQFVDDKYFVDMKLTTAPGKSSVFDLFWCPSEKL